MAIVPYADEADDRVDVENVLDWDYVGFGNG